RREEGLGLRSAVSFKPRWRLLRRIAPVTPGVAIMIRRHFVFPLFATGAIALAASLVACATPPADLDLSLKHASAQGRFVVEMEPPASGPSVGRIHAWTLKLATPDGAPVSQAHIGVDGGMPQHGHGLPTQPRVTREIAPG